MSTANSGRKPAYSHGTVNGVPQPPELDPSRESRKTMQEHRYPGCRVVTVELPLKPLAGEAEFAPGMIGRVVHLRLDEYQRTALYKMRQAMNDAHLRLKSGAHVDQYADVVKWILEQAT